MSDRERGDRKHEDQRGGGGRGGGQDTRFLQLEQSRVMLSDARRLAREAAMEVVKEEAKVLLRERFGHRLRKLAELAVAEEMADWEASLAIEEKVAERIAAREDLPSRLAEAMREAAAADGDDGVQEA